MTEIKKDLNNVLLSRMYVAAKAVFGVLAGSRARLVIIVLMLCIASVLIYLRVWVPLQKKVSTMEIFNANVSFDKDVLQEIHSARVERVEHKVRTYTTYVSLFAVSKDE